MPPHVSLAPRTARRALALVVFLAACGEASTAPRQGNGGDTPQQPARPAVASITLTPLGPALLLNGSRQIAVDLRAADGTPLNDRAVTWESSDPTIAPVTNGVVRGERTGTVVIRATSEGRTAEVTLTVEPVTVAELRVHTPQLQVTPGMLVHPQVIALAADGRVLLDRPVAVTVDDPRIVSRDAEGRLVAVAPGVTTVRYAADGKTAAVGVFVQAPAITGRWALSTAVEGAGTRCALSGMVLTIAGDGSATFTPAEGGMRSECQIVPGGEPPYATPTPPSIEVRVTRDGMRVQVLTNDGVWRLGGTLTNDARTIAGDARVVEVVDETTRTRTGYFTLQRLGN